MIKGSESHPLNVVCVPSTVYASFCVRAVRVPDFCGPASAFSPGPEKENWAAEEMEAMAYNMRPQDWPDGHPGYDGHPFAGLCMMCMGERTGVGLGTIVH